jgi:hypothetical protein
MPTLQVSLQVLLFLIFAGGGTYRFFQPMDALAKRMRWVSCFHPRIVRSIALFEVACGIGMVLPFLLSDANFPFMVYSGCLLMLIMLGAIVTHVVIGDYREIIGNLFLIVLLYHTTFSISF